MALQAKTKLVDGVRTDLKTNKPYVPTARTLNDAAPVTAAPAPAGPTPLSSTDLAPTKDIKLAAPPVAVGVAGGLGEMDAFAQSQQARVDETKKDYQTSKGGLDKFLQNRLSAEEIKIQKGETFGLPDIQTEVRGYTDELTREQTKLARQVEAIQTAPGTATAGERDRQVRSVQRDSYRAQADLSVASLAAQGRLADAQAAVDRAVALEFGDQEREIAHWERLVEDNKELFTKAETRQYETLRDERKSKLDEARDVRMLELQEKIKQRDPLYRLQAEKLRKEIDLLGEPTDAEKKATEAAMKEAQASIPAMRDKIAVIDTLKTHGGKNTRVGTSPWSRGPQSGLDALGRVFTPGGIFGLPEAAADTVTGSGQAFAGGVHKLTAGLSIDTLLQSKAQGATWGALSENELRILSNSASALNDWEIKDAKGNPTGYWNIDEASFNKEMDTIKTLTQRALVESGKSLISDDERAALDAIEEASLTPANYY